MLKCLINTQITYTEQNEADKINKYLLSLRTIYSSDLFRTKYNPREQFFNCRFFSIPQLFEILEYAKSNSEFLNELNNTRHMTTGHQDWFVDYNYYKKLKSA